MTMYSGFSHSKMVIFHSWWLIVVDLPLWKLWKSVGMMIPPKIWKNKNWSKVPTRYRDNKPMCPSMPRGWNSPSWKVPMRAVSPSGKTYLGLSDQDQGPVLQKRQRWRLVGGWATPLKNMKINWDDDIPKNNGKIIQSCSRKTTNQIYHPSIIHY